MNARKPISLQVEGLDDAAPSKMDQILERLNKRNKERQNYLDVKLEQRHKDSPDSEGTDYFSQAFADKVRDVEIRMKYVSDASSKNIVDDGPSIDLAHHFADITVDIQELQRYLTNSTMFLTDFKIKACQSVINDLTQTCEETRLRLMPKKKFGFRQRKVTPQPSLNPKLTKTVNEKADSISSNSKISYTLCNRTDAYLCLKGSEVNGIDVTIADLHNCFVEIQGAAGSLQISQCTDCIFLCGPIARSLFAEYCNNCHLSAACQQMRLHSSSQCCVNLHVTCRAIIEDCKGIKVAPYNYDYSGVAEDFIATNLNKEQNNYADVADFNWLSPDVPSPNWHLINDSPTSNWREKKEQFIKSYVDNSSL